MAYLATERFMVDYLSSTGIIFSSDGYNETYLAMHVCQILPSMVDEASRREVQDVGPAEIISIRDFYVTYVWC